MNIPIIINECDFNKRLIPFDINWTKGTLLKIVECDGDIRGVILTEHGEFTVIQLYLIKEDRS